MTTPLRVDAYFEALGDFPAWAVQDARLKINSGTVTDINKAFAPTPAQFADVVRNIFDPPNPFRTRLGDELRAEKRQRTLGIETTVDQPAALERGRVIKGFDDLKAEIKAKVDAGKPLRSGANPEASLRRHAANLGIDYDTAMSAIPDAPKHYQTTQ